MTVRQKSGERKKPNQYASPLRKMRRHKRKAINMSSSTSSSGIKDNSFLYDYHFFTFVFSQIQNHGTENL